MLRLIVRTDDRNMAAAGVGDVHTDYKTFDVDIPEAEDIL